MVKNLNEDISKQIKENMNLFAEEIIELQYIIQPHLIIKYNKMQKEKFLDDIKSSLNFLSISIGVDSKELYFNYITWLAKVIKNLKIPLDEMLTSFQCMKEILNKEIEISDCYIIERYVEESIQYFIYTYNHEYKDDQDNVENFKVKEFLEYLLNFEKEKAIKYIMDKIEDHTDIKEIYMEYLQVSLHQIGELWMEGKISVAKEHYCTAIIQHIISLMYPYIFTNTKKKNRTMFAVSAGEELHEIGIRMVTDFFELDGWNTVYLGSNISINSVIKELRDGEANLLAISITMGNNIQFAIDLINQIKRDSVLSKIKIIVGGRVFDESKDLWRKVEADGYGRNAVESVEIGNKLMVEEKIIEQRND